MKKIKWIIILINFALVVVLFNWSVFKKEETLANGKLILLALAPVDPRSLMQGDYMRLNYAISSAGRNNISSSGYIVVTLDHRGVADRVRFQKELSPKQTGEYLIKYRCPDEWSMNIGAESYFFEEGKAEKFENAKYGALKVDDNGNSILVGLYDEQLKFVKP